MEHITITERDLMRARSYVPLLEKKTFVDACAGLCMEKLDVGARKENLDQPMPPMYTESTERKSRCLMGALAKLYFGKTIEPAEGTDYLLAADDYDRWAGGHILNQVKRLSMKGDGPVRDKAHELLSDYRDLEKRLNIEVYGMLNVMNDPCTRLMAMFAMQTAPENLQRQQEELEKTKAEMMQQLIDLEEKKKEGEGQ